MPKSQPVSLPKFLVEDGLSQECKDLMSSLPKDLKGWLTMHLYQYQRFWHLPTVLQAILACQKHFQAQDSDILLVTNPKSGTTWLKAILFTLVNRMRYCVDDSTQAQHHPLLTNSPHDLVPYLEQVPDLTTSTSPRVFATHIPLASLPKSVEDSACKLVYLFRNPKDTFVSLWHFTNNSRPESLEMISLEEAFDRFCRGIHMYGPFWDHVLGFWKESLEKPEKVYFLKYEEMKEQPTLHLGRLAQFLGCPFSAEEETQGVVDEIIRLCCFDNLSNLEVNISGKSADGNENKFFFRRGEVGDWNNYLTAEMVERLDQIIEQKFYGSGLNF